MDLSISTSETGATLLDPFFAFGFLAITFAISLAGFCAVYLYRRAQPILWFASALCALIAWVLASEARMAIELTANIPFAIFNGGAGIGYWFMRPYVWASRSLGIAAFGFALFIRWRHARRTPARAA